MKIQENQSSTTSSTAGPSGIRHYENTQNIFQKAFVAVQCNCALCATELVLTVSHVNNGEIKEEAYCPQCDLRMRSKVHTVQ